MVNVGKYTIHGSYAIWRSISYWKWRFSSDRHVSFRLCTWRFVYKDPSPPLTKTEMLMRIEYLPQRRILSINSYDELYALAGDWLKLLQIPNAGIVCFWTPLGWYGNDLRMVESKPEAMFPANPSMLTCWFIVTWGLFSLDIWMMNFIRIFFSHLDISITLAQTAVSNPCPNRKKRWFLFPLFQVNVTLLETPLAERKPQTEMNHRTQPSIFRGKLAASFREGNSKFCCWKIWACFPTFDFCTCMKKNIPAVSTCIYTL